MLYLFLLGSNNGIAKNKYIPDTIAVFKYQFCRNKPKTKNRIADTINPYKSVKTLADLKLTPPMGATS